MYFRKDDTITTYLERKLAKSKYTGGISEMIATKQKAVEHFNSLSIEDRLSQAEFNNDYMRTTEDIGNLIYCENGQAVRIWITKEGKLSANRPKGY